MTFSVTANWTVSVRYGAATWGTQKPESSGRASSFHSLVHSFKELQSI